MRLHDGKAGHPALGPAAIPLIGAAAVLGAFHLLGVAYFDGFSLDLGSTNFPTPKYLVFVLVWIPLGTLAAILISRGVWRLWGPTGRLEGLHTWWDSVPDRTFQILASAAALLIPLLIGRILMKGSPITDDEGAYRFAAELLESGRLWVPSPPLKIFFDQNFIINDGRMYTAYFLGWPALMVPAVWVGAPWIANPVYSALTVPPLFAVIRRLAGPGWARGGILLFLSSPFIQVAAATGLAHTSCLMALTWCLLFFLRTQDPDAKALEHAGFAVCFSVAFWIRPQSAVALGFPLLLLWALGLRHVKGAPRAGALIGFAIPSATFASLFLLTLWHVNGSPWLVGYARSAQYLIENNFAFSTFRAEHLTAVPGFTLAHPVVVAAKTVGGLIRLNQDLFGWPSSLALAALSIPVSTRATRSLWAMVASGLTVSLFQVDWGIDTFGPVHAFELSLPILVLSIVGARHIQTRLNRPSEAACLFLGLIAAAQIGFVPVRFKALGQITAHLSHALEAPRQAHIHNAVIFAPTPFAPPCEGMPRHFVHFRPTNDPDLRRDVLWVNDLGPEQDGIFMETMDGREGYLMGWTSDCGIELLPLSSHSTISSLEVLSQTR